MIIKKPENDFIKERLPGGTYQAVCQSIHDIGLQDVTFSGETKRQHKCIIVWEVDERLKEGKFAGQRYVMNKTYTVSLHEKATLRHDLEAWRGKTFIEKELEAFDLDTIIGANCMLNVIEAKKGDKIYTNIAGIMPIAKSQKKLTAELPKDHVFEWIEKKKAAAVKPEPEQDFFVEDRDDKSENSDETF